MSLLISSDGCTVFCNLATDETLFLGEGDYQFDIYRKMKEINGQVFANIGSPIYYR